MQFSLRRADGRLKLITEIKFRSPSAGALSTVLSVTERARAYQRAGASMISVLCDTSFFDGAFAHLAEARAACELPLLCKEFVIDESQLDAAVAYGADAVLLIVRCLSEERLNELTLRRARTKAGTLRRSRQRARSRNCAVAAGATLDRRERARSRHLGHGCRARRARSGRASGVGHPRPPVRHRPARGRPARQKLARGRRPARRGADARSPARSPAPRARGRSQLR